MEKKNSINEQIFTALKVAEISKVPTLIISNPGAGKSSSVDEFSKIRNYHLIVLRGNSTTADEITGYDTVPSGIKEGERRAAVGLRPSWFQELMDVHEKGGKTLLFLDEITTAPEYTQAALLHLVFERSCKDEKFPEDTLIVAAGNYATNLTSSMTLLPPMMNRFMILNIVPTADDISSFLNFFQGAAVGAMTNKREVLNNLFRKMDAQEIKIDPEKYNRIGEIFEYAIRQTAERLCKSKTPLIDWTVTDLSTIYSDTSYTSTDTRLKGFATLRTLCYLVKWTVATYVSFGAAGINSSNFMNAVDGLCGIGLSKGDGKGYSSEVKLNSVGKEFKAAITNALIDVEKLNNDAIPEYENFFREIIGAGDVMSKEDLVAVINKIEAMKSDNHLKNLERPLEETLVQSLLEKLVKTGTKFKNDLVTELNVRVPESITDKELEKLGGLSEKWNYISGAFNKVVEFGKNPSLNYGANIITSISTTTEKLSKVESILKTNRKLVLTATNKSLTDSSLPKINPLVSADK